VTIWAAIQKWLRITRRFLKRQQANLPSYLSSRAGLLIITVILTIIIGGYQQFLPKPKIYNDVVKADIIAPRDFSIVDEETTAQLREQAVARTAPVFEYNSNLRKEISEQVIAQLAQGKNRVSLSLEQHINTILENLNNSYIYTTADATHTQGRRITLYNTETKNYTELRSQELVSLPVAQKRLQDELNTTPNLTGIQREYLTGLIKPLLTANLRYSEILTNKARAAAREQVAEITIQFRQNQIIARHGDPVTRRVLKVIDFLAQNDSQTQRLAKLLGQFIIIFALIFTLRRFSHRTSLRQRLGSARAFALICFTLLLQVILIQLGTELSKQLTTNFGITGSAIRYEFLIPYAGAALIMVLLLDAVAAQLCALIVCLLTGLISNGDMGLMAYAALSGAAATYGVERYRQRNSITRAATIIVLINIVAAITVMLISNQATSLEIYTYNILYSIGGGVLTAAFVSLVVPINESLFDILTDVKLLELSNMDLPLLRELAIHAPGTQQHSMMMSSLAEAAAESINANSILVRVGCYYHDIGKLMAPNLFIENQGGQPNPHDCMEPKRSVSAIVGHVKKGILMGQEAGLPTEVLDLIPQHHGTRKLHYFYNKALKQAAQTGEVVHEEHYRYPGPKPQTREAAIVMLADCAEAAARSLDEPTIENIRAIIKRIIDDLIADAQLEECDLTIRELNQICESLTQTLANLYHHRIKYPGFNAPNTTESSEKETTAEAKTLVAVATPAKRQSLKRKS
jgi:hypothetical protein